jgi:hypothetical protein
MLVLQVCIDADHCASCKELSCATAECGQLRAAGVFVARLVQSLVSEGSDLIAADHDGLRISL